jgi:uncharacterized protein (TIGR02678 family)
VTTTPERPAAAPDYGAEGEIRAAMRALLRTPLMCTATAAEDDLRLVRRHRAELGRLFADGLGYRLVVEPGVARLFKTGLGHDPTRPLRRRSGTPFTPRGYAMLALALAALTRVRSQLMVDELVAQVRSAAADAGMAVDLDTVADRRALHGALLALCDLGVLSERDGDLEHWAEQQTMSLLDVHRDRLALLVGTPLAGCASARDVVAVTSAPSAVGGARVAVRRHLAERPVLSHDDLSEEHGEWWRRNRNREKEWFRTRLGLELELRAEGALAVDPDAELTDVEFPAGGSGKHFALLLLEAVVNDRRAAGTAALEGVAWLPVAESVVRSHGRAVFDTWREGFKKAHRESFEAVYAEGLAVLTSAGLLRREDEELWLHAASARYAARPALVESGPSGERSLFDEEGA